jgi:hypothetical protein
MFAPICDLADRLPAIGWPDVAVLDHVADESGRRVVNARGQRIRFVHPASAGDALGFEPRVYLRGEVAVRPVNWHDLFNALAWIAFPRLKASLNARHAAALEVAPAGERSPVRDALTHFDEDGAVVLCAQPELSSLLRAFAWKALFVERRLEVRRYMRFFVIGHALYEKALAPFLGMTGKALVFDVAPAVLERAADALRAEVDRLTALHVLDPERMLRPRELCPLPVLGVPGWWPANEDARFYDDRGYFRPGRRAPSAGGARTTAAPVAPPAASDGEG